MRRLFLLGGVDLEMGAICDVLTECGEFFIDKKLSWENAFVSKYADELLEYGATDYTIYGVELIEDRDLPLNYVKLDHHNELYQRASSLEQVAAILNYKLNRRQHLIAINDAGYIDGMIRYGATQDEVGEIRCLDRACQGVTTQQELQAVEDLKNNLATLGDLHIVYTLLDRFSPITDRLYPYKNLIIYNDHEMVYYGEMKSCLVNRFQNYIDQGMMYHGGGDTGFLGTVSCCFSKEELMNLIEDIKSFYQHKI